MTKSPALTLSSDAVHSGVLEVRHVTQSGENDEPGEETRQTVDDGHQEGVSGVGTKADMRRVGSQLI